MNQPHTPVLLDEVLDYLNPRNGGVYIDATFGRGGYTQAILNAADCRVIAIDRDAAAIEYGRKLEQSFKGRLTLLHGRFSNLDHLVEGLKLSHIDGIVFDLGVSSPQLDEAARGFSFMREGPLDMRMGLSERTAADIVNTAPEKEIADILFRYGEEPKARQIARAIVNDRKQKPFLLTSDLSSLVRRIVKLRNAKVDAATKTFQALRMAVNEELQELERALQAAHNVLAPGGVLVVVSFHSLEDRMVKIFFRGHSRVTASRLLPHESPEPEPQLQLLTKKAVLPSPAEQDRNPRSRSAKLRAARKLETS